ncbi:MAG: HAMP domain-containing protein [Myxococcales bacterium]|nr:HAMP domain-containing protein [Myxococcales bacterium]
MRLSLATRIFLGYAVVLVTFGAVSIFSVAEMHRNQEEIRLVSEGYLHLAQGAAAIDAFHKNQEQETERLWAEKSVETRRALIRLARLYSPAQQLADGRERAERARALAPESERPFVLEVRHRFEELSRSYADYEQAAEQVFEGLESESPDWPQVTQKMDRLKQMENSVGVSIRLLHHALEARILERVALAERRERRSGVAIIGLSVLAIAVGLLATAISARTLRPVRTLIEGVSRIGRGDYSAQLGVRGDDEISTLAREFDAMARSLLEREAQLEEKQEALIRAEQLAAAGRISAQISHEVRNPLSSIGLNVEMLEEQLKRARFDRAEEAREAFDLLASVTREVDRLTEVTEQYLRLARPRSSTLAREDINQVLEGVLDFSREELQRSHVEVVRELTADSPKAMADEGQLRQVFLNLVRNSREAMGSGGRLTVRSSAADGQVEVTFRDTGPGMAKEVKERVFEPFFSTKEGGTGLGLAVSRQILQAHGGSIECESTPGSGTTFVIRLPRAS